MSLINRPPIKIERADGRPRDGRYFLIATEDTHAPKQYFEILGLKTVIVEVLETPKGSGLSAPKHVVDRAKAAYEEVKKNEVLEEGDEFWVLLDTDHHFKGNHARGTLEALESAKESGLEVAISNPCFELWLLLHHADVQLKVKLKSKDTEKQLRSLLGSYNKTNIQFKNFPKSKIPDAIRRARALEECPDNPQGWPKSVGTRVYRLMESIFGTSLK
jgi:hypothetical protein